MKRLVVCISLVFLLIGCNADWTLYDVLDGVTLTIENQTSNEYEVVVEDMEEIKSLPANWTISFQIFYGYNKITLTNIANPLDQKILEGTYKEPYTWIVTD